MKLKKLSKNVWFCEIWNSLVLNGHYGVYFTHDDWKVTDFCISEIGRFAGLTTIEEPSSEEPSSRVVIVDEFNNEEYNHIIGCVERVISYYHVNHKDPLETSVPLFYPRQYDIDAIRYFGDELGGTRYYEYSTSGDILLGMDEAIERKHE